MADLPLGRIQPGRSAVRHSTGLDWPTEVMEGVRLGAHRSSFHGRVLNQVHRTFSVALNTSTVLQNPPRQRSLPMGRRANGEGTGYIQLHWVASFRKGRQCGSKLGWGEGSGRGSGSWSPLASAVKHSARMRRHRRRGGRNAPNQTATLHAVCGSRRGGTDGRRATDGPLRWRRFHIGERG